MPKINVSRDKNAEFQNCMSLYLYSGLINFVANVSFSVFFPSKTMVCKGFKAKNADPWRPVGARGGPWGPAALGKCDLSKYICAEDLSERFLQPRSVVGFSLRDDLNISSEMSNSRYFFLPNR